MRRTMRVVGRVIGGSTILSGIGVVTYANVEFAPSTDETKRRLGRFADENDNTSSVMEGVSRFARATYTCLVCAYEYDSLFRKLENGEYESRKSEAYLRDLETLHWRCAERTLELCRDLGGIYVKVGQYVATLSPIVPEPWTTTLKALQDKAGSRPFHEISEFLRKELNVDNIEEIFESFDEEPIAAASLAQVHKAVLRRDKSEVAVKIQYPYLPNQVANDLYALEFLANAVAKYFPDFEFAWLLPEFEDVADIELDFVQERVNADRMRELLSETSNVYVPRVINDLSGRRVLTMEYVRGERVDDFETLSKMSIDPKFVASKMCEVFGDMMFVHGLVHCDPHPGNLLVRKDSNGEAQLVVLDHGMYRRLDPSFRHNFSELFSALVLRDREAVKRSSKSMRVESDIGMDALSLILTFRTVSTSTPYGTRLTNAERSKVRSMHVDIGAKDVNNFIQRLPRDLLFCLRTMSIVRSINRTLGGTTFDRIVRFSESALKGRTVIPQEEKVEEISPWCSELARVRERRLNHYVDTELSKVTYSISWFLARLTFRFRLWVFDSYLRLRGWYLGINFIPHPPIRNDL